MFDHPPPRSSKTIPERFKNHYSSLLNEKKLLDIMRPLAENIIDHFPFELRKALSNTHHLSCISNHIQIINNRSRSMGMVETCRKPSVKLAFYAVNIAFYCSHKNLFSVEKHLQLYLTLLERFQINLLKS